MKDILFKMGFTRDNTSPVGVERYERSDMDTYFSVTLDGDKTAYGCFLFNKWDNASHKKRKFEGDITADELKAIMDINRLAPAFVREFPMLNP